MYPNSISFDPGLLWLDDDEPEPIAAPEMLTMTSHGGWWTAAPFDSDD